MNPSNSSRRALLLVNPGARRAESARDSVLRAFAAAGVACDAVLTQGPGDARAVARERASDYDMVFTLGGDGTATEVITALADRGDKGPPIGVLRGGTGNVLARALGISPNMRRAVAALLGGGETRVDLGRLPGGRHFAIGLGVGLDEAMIAGATPLMKKWMGVLAYVWSALRAVLRFETFGVRLTVDSRSYERRAAFVIVANVGSVRLLGLRIRLGDGIEIDDGVLHGCIFSPTTRWQAVRTFARILGGRVREDPGFLQVAGRHFRLETDPPRRAQADGELLEFTPIEITTRPRAARLLIPRP